MPTYVYEREDGSQFEFKQRITEEPLEECPETGQEVHRVIQPANVHFKGDGFHTTDFSDADNPNI